MFSFFNSIVLKNVGNFFQKDVTLVIILNEINLDVIMHNIIYITFHNATTLLNYLHMYIVVNMDSNIYISIDIIDIIDIDIVMPIFGII